MSVDLPDMSEWMLRKNLKNSRSDELEKLEDGRKQPFRSTSVRKTVSVNKGLLHINQRHNSMVLFNPMSNLESFKARKQTRSYFNSPVKRSTYFKPRPQITLQGRLTRPEGATRYRLQAAFGTTKAAHCVR